MTFNTICDFMTNLKYVVLNMSFEAISVLFSYSISGTALMVCVDGLNSPVTYTDDTQLIIGSFLIYI